MCATFCAQQINSFCMDRTVDPWSVNSNYARRYSLQQLKEEILEFFCHVSISVVFIDRLVYLSTKCDENFNLNLGQKILRGALNFKWLMDQNEN